MIRLVNGSKKMYLTYVLDRIIFNRLLASKQHAMLLGPRQTGKSTLAKALSPILTINFADEPTYLSHQRDPRLLRQRVDALSTSGLIVIDEVQRIPSILNTLQALIDENPRGHRFLLTGSSARKLRRGGANLLPGRVVQERLSPLLLPEVGDKFDLERALQIGMLPGMYLSEDGADLLESYSNTYLREEIQAEGLVENIGGFARLLDTIAVSSGRWLNYSKLASDTEIPKETIRRYVSILEDTLVLERLEPFRISNRSDRRVRQKEKVLLFDIGVRNALLRLHRSSLPATLQGEQFEQFVTLQVLGLIRAHRLPWKACSFLGASDQEIDIVLDTPDLVIALEIKRGHRLHERKFPAFTLLEELCHGYKPVQKLIAYTGGERLKLEDGTEVLHYLELFKELFDAQLPAVW